MNDYDSTQDTLGHIEKVREAINVIRDELLRRALVHDQSKICSPEKEVFDEVTPKLKALTYGSDEYKSSLTDMGEALNHHYAANDHHPEHHQYGIRDMDLVQVIEMFCDWCAATQRHEDGDILKSIENNEGRFETGPVLASIFRNTAIRYELGKNHVEVPE